MSVSVEEYGILYQRVLCGCRCVLCNIPNGFSVYRRTVYHPHTVIVFFFGDCRKRTNLLTESNGDRGNAFLVGVQNRRDGLHHGADQRNGGEQLPAMRKLVYERNAILPQVREKTQKRLRVLRTYEQLQTRVL